ncbi:MAG: hypothetical protein ABFD97_02415 [Syntrophobacter sp.]
MNANNNERLMELLCAAVDIKEKMRALYREAAGKCSDAVGTGTFNMLEELEGEHLVRLQTIQKDLAEGGEAGFDSCRMYDFGSPEKKDVMKRISRERRTIAKACLDDVAAIQSGMALENKGIDYFVGQLKQASSPAEREVLNHLIAEEREHYIMLADLKFYYIDPEHWFMEKGRTDLDGAGAVS